MTRLGLIVITYQNNRTMKKETKQQNSTDTQMGYDTVLAAVIDFGFYKAADGGYIHDQYKTRLLEKQDGTFNMQFKIKDGTWCTTFTAYDVHGLKRTLNTFCDACL